MTSFLFSVPFFHGCLLVSSFVLISRAISSQDLPFRCYFGYDTHEDIAFQVAKYSLEVNSTIPVHVIPLKRKELQDKGIYKRSQYKKQRT